MRQRHELDLVRQPVVRLAGLRVEPAGDRQRVDLAREPREEHREGALGVHLPVALLVDVVRVRGESQARAYPAGRRHIECTLKAKYSRRPGTWLKASSTFAIGRSLRFTSKYVCSRPLAAITSRKRASVMRLSPPLMSS